MGKSRFRKAEGKVLLLYYYQAASTWKCQHECRTKDQGMMMPRDRLTLH
jgi:peroxiredoxin